MRKMSGVTTSCGDDIDDDVVHEYLIGRIITIDLRARRPTILSVWLELITNVEK